MAANHPIRVRSWFPQDADCLDPANPFAILPDRLERSEIARIQKIFGGGQKLALFHVVPGVTGADADELQDARIAIAVNHTASAAVTNELGGIKLVNIAHGRF